MYTAPLHNEDDLLRRLSGGDEAAFERLYKHYGESMRSFLIRYFKAPEFAEDLSQEIFIKIWENRERISQVQSFRAYLFTVARNHALNVLKRAAKIDAAQGLMIQSMGIPVTQPDDSLISGEYRQWLHNVLKEMNPNMRQVFQLIRQESRTYDEVAELLGISRNTVKKHMLRSLKIIRTRLDDELGLSLAVFLLITMR
ncbi:MAG TPA: RNA polymerase sigma-70 factor [Flavitalea sp.]|nr:RNA polymerase sigma-70 factor [Flavitalea sp.]